MYAAPRTPSHAALQPPIPLETLREYIAYARTKCQPVLSDEALKALVDGYLDMRRMGSSRNVRNCWVGWLVCHAMEVSQVDCTHCTHACKNCVEKQRLC